MYNPIAEMQGQFYSNEKEEKKKTKYGKEKWRWEGVGVNLEGVHLEEVSPSLEQSPSGFSEHPFKRITN